MGQCVADQAEKRIQPVFLIEQVKNGASDCLKAFSDFSVVLDLINSDKISKDDIRFFLGYSGWAEEQLDNELESNAWLVLENVYDNQIISKSCTTFWREKMLELGGDYSIWSNAPENPSYN